MNVLFATEDWILIKHYRLDNRLWQKVNMHKFPNKPWSASGLDTLIKKIDDTGVQTVLMVVVGLNHLEPENWPPNNPANVDLS